MGYEATVRPVDYSVFENGRVEFKSFTWASQDSAQTTWNSWFKVFQLFNKVPINDWLGTRGVINQRQKKTLNWCLFWFEVKYIFLNTKDLMENVTMKKLEKLQLFIIEDNVSFQFFKRNIKVTVASEYRKLRQRRDFSIGRSKTKMTRTT